MDAETVATVSYQISQRIIDAIENEVTHIKHDPFWDHDDMVNLVWTLIPATAAETELDARKLDEMIKAIRPPGPSLMQQLRDVLGIDPAASLRTTLGLAINRLKGQIDVGSKI